MLGERIQRRIETLLDEAEESVAERDWQAVAEQAGAGLAIDGSGAKPSAARAV